MEDAFIINKANRYNVKGRKYIGTPLKYYFEDVGLRNARLGFRQVEETHLMENIIYNELRSRGYSVDVGVVEKRGTDENGKEYKNQLEIVIVVKDVMNVTRDEDGITTMSIYDFLLKENSLEL